MNDTTTEMTGPELAAVPSGRDGAKLPAALTADTMLTMAQAAIACAVSKDTIERRRKDGTFPDAIQGGPMNAWLIPVRNLTAAGLLPAERVAETLQLIESTEVSKATAEARFQIRELTASVRHLEQQLHMAREEIAFLRPLVAGKAS